jgi:hypothetical protein
MLPHGEDESAPLVVDFTPRRFVYAGDVGAQWFASALHEPRVVALNNAGQVVERFECPFVDRVVSVGDSLLGLAWAYAWGRRWGHSLGEREDAAGYDVRSGRRLWHLGGGISGLIGNDLAIGRETPRADAPHHIFDLRTGDKRWSFSGWEPVVSSDAEVLYVLAREGSITAYEIPTGKQRWCFEPPEHRRVKGYLCRALAITERGIWYVSHPADEHAVLTCLSRTSGEPVDEREFRGWVNNLVAVGDALILHHEFGLAVVDGSRDGEVKVLTSSHPDASVRGDGIGAALLADATLVVVSSASASPNMFTLAGSWKTFHIDKGVVTLGDGSRLLRWPLSFNGARTTVEAKVVTAEQQRAPLEAASVVFSGPALVLVEHPSRGRFTLKVANTGLAKGDAVAIGGFVPGPTSSTIATELSYTSGGQTKHVAIGATAGGSGNVVKVAERTKERRERVPPSVRRLIESLTTHHLMKVMSDAEISKLSLRMSSATVGTTATAEVLRLVHGDRQNALAFGFLSHDWRFGQETQDVIAEFAACLKGEPIRFEQIETKPNALRVRSSRLDSRDDDWIDLEDRGLDAVARFLNEKLEGAMARRRVFSLETDGDWHAFIVRTGDEVAAMREAGVPGISVP